MHKLAIVLFLWYFCHTWQNVLTQFSQAFVSLICLVFIIQFIVSEKFVFSFQLGYDQTRELYCMLYRRSLTSKAPHQQRHWVQIICILVQPRETLHTVWLSVCATDIFCIDSLLPAQATLLLILSVRHKVIITVWILQGVFFETGIEQILQLNLVGYNVHVVCGHVDGQGCFPSHACLL